MERRYKQTCWYVASLLADHKYPYSPIVANHRFAQEFNLRHDAAAWMSYNFAMMSAASHLHVLTLDGWPESIGVQAEIAFWRGAKQGLPLQYATMDWTKIAEGDLGEKCARIMKDG